MNSLHVTISGRVQGVSFRWSTQQRARELGLTGWVRNLPDGRVEAMFYGNQELLDEMLEWCGRGPAIARVDNVEPAFSESEDAPDSFTIR